MIRHLVGWSSRLNTLSPLPAACEILPGLHERGVFDLLCTLFQMMQKSLAASVPIVAAISAPGSLAEDFARDSGQTLVGFCVEKE